MYTCIDPYVRMFAAFPAVAHCDHLFASARPLACLSQPLYARSLLPKQQYTVSHNTRVARHGSARVHNKA
jgi:hypothetical protein